MAAAASQFPCKRVSYGERDVPILMQNENGPCPLLALANVLLLRDDISIHADKAHISFSELTSLIAEWMLEHEASTTSGTWSSGNGESFSRDASHNGSSTDGTDAGSSQRQANVKSHLSATAITYCDLMTLGVRDLASLLARESSWASLAKKDKASFSTERGFAKIRKALTMGSFVGRWSRRTSTGTDAAEPTTPARSGARPSCCSNSGLSTGDRSEHDEPAGDAQGPRAACPSRASSMGSVLLALAAREREREAAESSRTEAEVQQSV